MTNVFLGATDTAIWQKRNFANKNDMLNVDTVANEIYRIATLPLDIRMDAIEILPDKGVL